LGRVDTSLSARNKYKTFGISDEDAAFYEDLDCEYPERYCHLHRKDAVRETKVRAAEINTVRDEDRMGPLKGQEKQTSQGKGDLVSSGIANGDIEMRSESQTNPKRIK
jgi:hypothetical protein